MTPEIKFVTKTYKAKGLKIEQMSGWTYDLYGLLKVDQAHQTPGKNSWEYIQAMYAKYFGS